MNWIDEAFVCRFDCVIACALEWQINCLNTDYGIKNLIR